MPQLLAKKYGVYSLGYMVRVYNGDPDAGGTELTTTIDQSGSVVGWIYHFGLGMLKTASSFTGIINPNDVWIKGFRYIGRDGTDLGGSIGFDKKEIAIDASLISTPIVTLLGVPKINSDYVTLNGLELDSNDYTLSGDEMTIHFALKDGDTLIIRYAY